MVVPNLVVAMFLILAGRWGKSATSAPVELETVRDGIRARVAKEYEATKSVYSQMSTNATAAWQFARACYDLAEFSTNDSQRAAAAHEGIKVSRELIDREPGLAPGLYYLGMNLGQLARTASVRALRLVKEMEESFKRALELDRDFDYAGPDRCLGLLYLDAPGWPLSVGSRRKARMHLEQAVTRSPDYPENRLNLLEACLRWNDQKTSRREWQALKNLLPQARMSFAGENWEAAWIDWDRRWRSINVKVKPASDAYFGVESDP